MRNPRINVDDRAHVAFHAEQLFKTFTNLRYKILLPLQSPLQYWICLGSKLNTCRVVNLRQRTLL